MLKISVRTGDVSVMETEGWAQVVSNTQALFNRNKDSNTTKRVTLINEEVMPYAKSKEKPMC